jgi:hypothetical protein
MFTAKTALRVLVAVFFFAARSPAHELWIEPDPPTIDSSARSSTHEIAIRMFTGERFHGEELGWDPERCAELRDFAGDGFRDLTGEPGAAPAAYLSVGDEAVHLLSYRSHPFSIEIDARTFNRYLLEHGLQEAWRARQERGELDRPGRERFTRYCKAVVAPAAGKDGSAANRTADEDRTAYKILGHRLEIVPAPAASGAAGIPFQILFENKPLAQAVVFASPRSNAQEGLVRAVTNANGMVTFDLQDPGLWLISIVHMIPCNPCPDADWESCWASLVLSSPVHALGSVP